MRLLLGSGGIHATEQRRALATREIRRHFAGVRRILLVPYALADHDAVLQRLEDSAFYRGFELDSMHRHDDAVAAVQGAEGLSVGGGNTFRLVRELYDRELIEAIRARVRDGCPYFGVSAGSNVACPTLQTTNDMPITQPPSFETLGLVSFQINPHYHAGPMFWQAAGEWVEHCGETRDERIREYHQLHDRPVVGLPEGAFLRVEDGRVTLVGAPARIFRRGQEPVDVEPGDLGGALS